MRVLVYTLTMCLFVLPVQAQYSGGSGTAHDPYQIATAADLIVLGETPDDYDKHFILTADIDLDPNLPGGEVFDRAVIAPSAEPGRSFDGTPFTGDLDGRGYSISYLKIVGEDFLGMFGYLNFGARLSNIRVELIDVNGTGSYVGGLVGRNDGGSITGCSSSGEVIGGSYVGGLVGINGNNEDGFSVREGGTDHRLFQCRKCGWSLTYWWPRGRAG